MFNPVKIVSEQDYDAKSGKHSLEIYVTFENFHIYRPQIHENNGATKLMFPQEARLRNFTYASAMTIDMNIKFVVRNGASLENTQTFYKTLQKIHIGNNIKKKFKAIITVDTVPISEGFVQFKSSFVKSGKMSDFAITFYGEQVDLGVVLKDKDFTALNYNDAIHLVSFTNCRTVNNGGTIGGNDYSDHKLMWTMIDKGQQFMAYPSDLQGTFVNAPYSYGTYDQPDNIISVDMLTPCLKGAYLIDKINDYIIGQNGRPISLSTNFLIVSKLPASILPNVLFLQTLRV